MTGSLVFPLAVTLAVVAVATSGHRRLPPRIAARFVVGALMLAVVAAAPTALVVTVAFVAHVPVVGVGFEWCARAIGMHGSISPWIGLPCTLAVAVGAWRVTSTLTRHRRLRVGLGSGHDVHVRHSSKPYALTLPGPAGQIVLSSALVELLDHDEQQVVLAHEQAHARYRHDRFLLAAELAAAALPPLRGLARRVHFSIERWADEVAARACGDRELVAMTLGKVALHASDPMVPAFAGLGVASRMEALFEPPPSTPRRVVVLGLWVSLCVAAGFAAYQLHHLEHLIMALCPH